MKNEKPAHTALLLTFYWPPAGGPGVHRWLRFSKYFTSFGWNLHVYCPDNAAWPIVDPALEAEVPEDITIVRRSIFEPHKYLGKQNNPNVGGGITRSKKSSFVQRAIIWIRGNLFIPDARVFWIVPSARYLKKYLKQHPEIDTIISSGPPHSLHLIALRLKKKFPNLKWVADFRDPWTDIDFYGDLAIGKWADSRHKRLEKEVLTKADYVITVSEACASGLAAIGNRAVEVFTNGYNFPEVPVSAQLTAKFEIGHFGSMSFARNPEVVWKALAELLKEIPTLKKDLSIRLVGPVDFSVFERIETHQLTSFVDHSALVTHQESILAQQQTQILLLVANNTGNVKGILTGKLFEYLGAGRPILAIGEKDSNMQGVIETTNAGQFADYHDIELVKNTLRKWYSDYQSGNLTQEAENLEQFSSKTIIEGLLKMIG